MKGKEEASETMPTEKEATQLSDTEFKAMVFRKLTELTENYQKLQGNYNDLTANYIIMKKEKRNYQQGPRGILHFLLTLVDSFYFLFMLIYFAVSSL